MKTYISNPKLSDNKVTPGVISLNDGEFYFTFTIAPSDNFDLRFIFQEYGLSNPKELGFAISNTSISDTQQFSNEIGPDNKNYTVLSNVEKEKDTGFLKDLDGQYDVIYIRESFLDKTEHPYLRGDSPTLKNLKYTEYDNFIHPNGTEYILPDPREQLYTIVKQDGGKYKLRRKMDSKTIIFRNIAANITKYYFNSNNIYDSKVRRQWKVIISQYGKSITVFTRNSSSEPYKETETIFYNENIENCSISLSVNEQMILSDCSFRFFKADIS